jgi:hypothetical protein
MPHLPIQILLELAAKNWLFGVNTSNDTTTKTTSVLPKTDYIVAL